MRFCFRCDNPLIPTKIIPSVRRQALSTQQVGSQFLSLCESVPLKLMGTAKLNPGRFVKQNVPSFHLRLFDTDYYLTEVYQIPELRFMVAYIVQRNSRTDSRTIFPRLFYKDLSLAWRCASHLAIDNGAIWVGKGDVKRTSRNGYETIESIEATTDLPLEIQTEVDSIAAIGKPRTKGGQKRLEAVLRQSPPNRVEPYRNFVAPRRLAQSNRANLINRGQPIAHFENPRDPQSLVIVEGYAPDFSKHGVLERSKSKSKLYGGQLQRFRILSINREVQYYFIAGKNHVWLLPCQAFTTDLSSYGVRTIDVEAHDALFIPGYEYHHYEETSEGVELYSQIPEGFAGEVCPLDDAKADASRWLDQIPVIREFRRKILKRR